MYKYLFIWLIAGGCITAINTGCNTRKIADNDALYTGASIQLVNSTVSGKEEKVIKSDLKGLTRPKPNSKLLGIRLKLSIYNLAGKSNKGLNKFIKKFGEPPVLASQVNLETNEKLLTNTLENKGFFHARVKGDTTIKNKKAEATYEVATGPQYTINQVNFPQDSSRIAMAIRQIAPQSILKTGEAFNLDVIKGERLRIDAYLKEHGYYYFNPEHLIVLVDSTIGNNQVNLFVNMKPEMPNEGKEVYTINNVYIYSNYNLNTARRDTLTSDSVLHAGYVVIDRSKTFNPKVFERIMTFHPGELYNRTDHNASLNRLINLGTFKFVKNRFEPVQDSFKLDSYYYLTPSPKKSISAEVGGNFRSTNATGSELIVRWRNRNAFKGAEQLSISGYLGSEVQVSGQYGGNTYRLGAEANLSIPRYLVPFFRLNTRGAFVPRTTFQLGYDLLNRTQYFTLNSFRGQVGYVWKENVHKEHQLNPLVINYVQPVNITKAYTDSVAKNPLFARPTRPQFILGSSYNFNYNGMVDKAKNATGFYFNGLLDLSGNIAGLLTKPDVKAGDTVKLFGAAFSQYFKTELDARYYRRIGLKHQWANRIIFGYGLPYGNSSILPYTRQFFVGGNNSLRGFRSRSVGPGTFNVGQKDAGSGIYPDATGDIKLEFNTEFRYKFTDIFYGALFFDAGNIWLYNDDPLQPGGQFTKDFLKELAMDAGIGVRIDVTILLLRFDVAVPLRDPSYPPGQRSTIPNLRDRDFRRQNTVFNIAIGLPF